MVRVGSCRRLTSSSTCANGWVTTCCGWPGSPPSCATSEVRCCSAVAPTTGSGVWSAASSSRASSRRAGLLREIEEETGVVARIEALAGVWTQPEVTYPNGDRAQYLDLCFLARHVSGQARVNDDESTEVGWFAVDDLPDGLADNSRRKLATALAFAGRARFVGDGEGDGYAAVPDAGAAVAAATVGGAGAVRRGAPPGHRRRRGGDRRPDRRRPARGDPRGPGRPRGIPAAPLRRSTRTRRSSSSSSMTAARSWARCS